MSFTIDGSMGEGGGQLLRSSLALSLLTGAPFRITKIRAGRARPGLMRQHLVAVLAAAKIGGAKVTGDELGSTEISFEPRAIAGGDHAFAIGGAGSTTLVFQTILLPLLLGTPAGTAPCTLTFDGGTHNPMAPPFEFLQRAFLPVLARMGGRVEVTLERHGFYPAGGGRFTAVVHRAPALTRLDLLHRGEVRATSATAVLAQVAPSVGLRELDVLAARLGWDRAACKPAMVERPHGPGNVLMATVESAEVTEMFTGFGERGVRAETVAEAVAHEAARYIEANVPVGEHLADQLLLPMALGAGGVFRTVKPSQHCLTQIELLKLFLGTEITTTEETEGAWRIEVRGVQTKLESA